VIQLGKGKKIEASGMKKKRTSPEMIDAENPEWTKSDFKRADPLSELPKAIQNATRKLKQKRERQ
jgi:hypothetical protein